MEMYDGGHGYFKVALATNGPFSKQHGTSYFAIEFGNWVIFGLDTAYYDPSLLVMEGALVDPNQLGFIRSFNLVGKKVMVITHHNGLSVDGLKPTGLWSDLYKALGKRNPDYWYWGHVHNGVIYQQSATGTTLARCIGHAALPFGNAYGLHDPTGNPIPSVVYYAHTPLGQPQSSAEEPRAEWLCRPDVYRRHGDGDAVRPEWRRGMDERGGKQHHTVGRVTLLRGGWRGNTPPRPQGWRRGARGGPPSFPTSANGWSERNRLQRNTTCATRSATTSDLLKRRSPKMNSDTTPLKDLDCQAFQTKMSPVLKQFISDHQEVRCFLTPLG